MSTLDDILKEAHYKEVRENVFERKGVDGPRPTIYIGENPKEKFSIILNNGNRIDLVKTAVRNFPKSIVIEKK